MLIVIDGQHKSDGQQKNDGQRKSDGQRKRKQVTADEATRRIETRNFSNSKNKNR